MSVHLSHSIRGIFPILLIALFSSSALGQQTDSQEPDTTFAMAVINSSEVVVTAKRPGSPSLDQLLESSELNTTVSGVTQDMHRDLPAILRIYTPYGIPLLTKYTSNNSLTPTIPNSAVRMELREPGAKFPNPDAPVIMQTDYSRRGTVSLSPLNQSLAFGSGTGHRFAGNVSMARSDASKLFKNLIPQLHAYNTTYAGYGSFQANIAGTKTEAIVLHSQSNNEYSELLNVDHFLETDRSTNIFVNSEVSLGETTLHGGFAHQSGRVHQEKAYTSYEYEVTNEISAYTYTAALSSNRTELRVNYHDLQREYPYGESEMIHMQRFETLITHQRELFSNIRLTAEGRFDHRDKEPSISGELKMPLSDSFSISLNSARLYDAVGSEGLNNLMGSVQMAPHPWTTTYIRAETRFQHKNLNVHAAITNKNLDRGWYEKTAESRGWIARIGANKLHSNIFDGSYLKWTLEGVYRSLSLDTSGPYYHVMPGPARMEGHASIEAGLGSMEYAIQTDVFMERHMRVQKDVVTNMGSQYYLSMNVSRKIGVLKLGAEFNNILGFFGKDNYIMAHVDETDETSFVSAPPVVNLTLDINLF